MITVTKRKMITITITDETTSQDEPFFFTRLKSSSSIISSGFWEGRAEQAKKHSIKIKVLKEAGKGGNEQSISFITFDELKDI
jgi:hypothetical protein